MLIDSIESCESNKQFEIFFTKVFDKSEQKEFGGFLDLLLTRPKLASFSSDWINPTLRRPFLVDLPEGK